MLQISLYYIAHTVHNHFQFIFFLKKKLRENYYFLIRKKNSYTLWTLMTNQRFRRKGSIINFLIISLRHFLNS
jgi:hypothetical protein